VPLKDAEQRPLTLILEDDAAIATLYHALLEDEGFEVHGAADGNKFLQDYMASLRDKKRPAFLILDSMVPGMSGEEVYKEIQQINIREGIQVGIVWASGAMKSPLEELPGVFTARKPFELDTLISICNKARAWTSPLSTFPTSR